MLVEANPESFKELISKNRKVWSMNACISSGNYPEIVEFDASGLVGGIIQHGINPSHNFYEVSKNEQ